MVETREAWSRPRWGGDLPIFTLHVFRVLVRICRTSKMTACSPPAVVASRTSFGLLGLIGIWPLASLQSAQSAAGAPYTVRGVSTHGLLRYRCASLGTSRGYHTFRFDVDHRLTPCRHVRSAGSCLFAIIRRLPTRLGSTREKVHGSCMVGRV